MRPKTAWKTWEQTVEFDRSITRAFRILLYAFSFIAVPAIMLIFKEPPYETK